MNRDRKFSF